MAKSGWCDLLARFPEPHIVVAALPDLTGEESVSNAQSAQRLLVRLIRKLPTAGAFAVTVSRQSGKREVLCAFEESDDADIVAKAAKATKAPVSARARYSFVLDEKAERRLSAIAGPAEPHRRPRTTPHEGWRS